MSETVERQTIHRSPLHDNHLKLGSRFEQRDGWVIPASYDNPTSEYVAVRGGGAGVVDLSLRGRIEVSGSEAVAFFNGLITNDLKTLEDGAAMDAAFPNVQGRLVAYVRILRLGDKFLVDTEAATHNKVLSLLNRFTLAGDFRVYDATSETALLSIQGMRASEIIAATFGDEVARISQNRSEAAGWQGASITILRASHTSEDGFDLFVKAPHAISLWDKIVESGAQPVGFEALEVLRIEAGIPRYGIDMDESRVVLETGLDHAVSFAKGCYLGQEIISRIHWRGHVAKRLSGLRFRDIARVQPGDRITAEGREIGLVTSSVFSPALNRQIALGYVKYDHLSSEEPVYISSTGDDSEQHMAEIVALPFVRGSWYENPSPKEKPG